MPEITLASGDTTIVSDADFGLLGRWRWKRHPQGYASRTGYEGGRFVTILMHRLITDAPSHAEVHHKNGNKLDNRRENLELVAAQDHRMKHVGPLVQSARRRQQYPDHKRCARCGGVFQVNPRKRRRSKCCSSECAQQMRVQAALEARGVR